MSGFPGISRVTDGMVIGRINSSLQRSLAQMAASELAIASGRRFSTLGEAPLAARRTVGWERLIERHEQYGNNIATANSRLAATEGSLAELEEMIQRAREIALEQVQSTATDETRELAMVEIHNLVAESVTLANRQYGERYLFGGNSVGQAPFSMTGNYVSYAGDATETMIEVAPGMLFEAGISGVRAFGGWSSEVTGGTDLDPVLNLETPLSSLNGGRGIANGRIEIRDGSGASQIVDLEGARTIEDVIERINETNFATAALDLSRNGIQITKNGANLSVIDLNGSTAARDLGIAQMNAGPNLGGFDLDPTIRPLTRLSLLRNGLGVDPDGFTIQNGNLSASIDLTGVETVEGFLNAINTAGIAAEARISSDHGGIEIVSRLAGADLRVIEGTGQTASQLGFIVPSADIDLDKIHGGRGLSTVEGADFQIVAGNGVAFDVDVSGAVTLGDVVDQINQHPGNTGVVFAEVIEGEDRIRLRDQSGGPDDLRVESRNGSFAASGLRIQGTATANILEGGDLQPGGVRLESAFDGFALLEQGLATSDPGDIQGAIRALDAASRRVLQAQAEVGSRLRRLDISERRNELETLETQQLLSQESDTDIAEAIVRFNREQMMYQAALQTSAQLMQQSILDFLG